MNHDTPSAACVSRGCQREDCRARRRAYQTKIKKRHRAGLPNFMDATLVQRKIQKDTRKGFTHEQLAEAYGIPQHFVRRYAVAENPRNRRIRVPYAQRILTAKPTGEGHSWFDSTGTTRRLRALVADGHGHEELRTLLREDGLEVSIVWIKDSVRGKYVKTSGKRHYAVKKLFSRLQMTPGSDARAARRASKVGWARPLEWDEDRIDDPLAKPYRTRRRSS